MASVDDPAYWMLNSAIQSITPGWFRLILATVVVLYHTSRVIFFGYWAVFVFFILSGYWLTEMYRAKYQKAKHTTLVFQASRVIRIMPVFAASSLVGLAIAWCGFDSSISALANDPCWIARALLPLGNSALHPRLIETAWSLDIEVQFYILYPLIFTAVISADKRSIAYTTMALAILLWLFGYQHSLMVYFGFFLIGIVISNTNWQASPRLLNVSLLALAALVVGAFIFPTTRASLLASGDIVIAGHDFTRALDVILTLLAVPFVSVNVRIKETKFGYHAGNISYPIYLIHWVLLTPYISWFGGLSQRERLPFFLGYLAATFFLSLLVYAAIDRPTDRWRRDFVSRYTRRKQSDDLAVLTS